MTEPIGNVKLRPLPPGQRHCQSIGARVAWEWFFFEQRESRYCCRIEGCAASFCMTNNVFFSHLRKHGVTKTDYRVLQGLPVATQPTVTRHFTAASATAKHAMSRPDLALARCGMQ